MNSRNFIVIIVLLISFYTCSTKNKQNYNFNTTPEAHFKAPEGGMSLFNGTDLSGWKITNFGTEGPIQAVSGSIVINMGDGCSGITWTNDFPNVNYEVNLEARRTAGNDFFCGLTFPVNEDFCSFIVGGWGGPVLGLSCIDGLDAGDNETNTMKRFDKNVWYKIKLQVTSEKIIAWIDNEKLIDFNYTGRKLSVRPEVELSKPFGICTWITSAELRNIWVREIQAAT